MKKLHDETSIDGTWDAFGVDYAIPFFPHRNTLVMAANIAQSFTVPAGASKVYFNITPQGATYWVDETKTAVIPASIINGTAPEMNPAGRVVTPGQTLSVITAVASAIIQACYEG